jgi:hypothetical protein
LHASGVRDSIPWTAERAYVLICRPLPCSTCPLTCLSIAADPYTTVYTKKMGGECDCLVKLYCGAPRAFVIPSLPSPVLELHGGFMDFLIFFWDLGGRRLIHPVAAAARQIWAFGGMGNWGPPDLPPRGSSRRAYERRWRAKRRETDLTLISNNPSLKGGG